MNNMSSFKESVPVFVDGFDGGEKVDTSKHLPPKGQEARDLFIKLFSNPEVVESNTKIIASATNLEDLINKIRQEKTNIISPDPNSGIFKIYANDYILEELNFINEHLGSNSKNLDVILVNEAKLKAKSLTRACGLRYKVRYLLAGVK
jgi:hypothetical protein